jgi:hypothetical protein
MNKKDGHRYTPGSAVNFETFNWRENRYGDINARHLPTYHPSVHSASSSWHHGDRDPD